MRQLEYEQGYWLAQVDEIARPPATYALRQDLGAAAYDGFCTANLSVFPAWERAVSLLLDHGMANMEAHDQRLVDQLLGGLPAGWRLRSPRSGAERSTLVLLELKHPDTVERALARLDAADIDAAERDGWLRIAPHIHNTTDDIDRVLTALAR
jgi:selenocysteine lyase/cysteine desulfurase